MKNQHIVLFVHIFVDFLSFLVYNDYIHEK